MTDRERKQMLLAEDGATGLIHLTELGLRLRQQSPLHEQVGKAMPHGQACPGWRRPKDLDAVGKDAAVFGLGPLRALPRSRSTSGSAVTDLTA